MLGFSVEGSEEKNFPIIGDAEKTILERFVELYPQRGNILEALIKQAKKKYKFSEVSVKFWAKTLIDGKFGPFEPLLSEDLEEILVNGINEPFFVYDRKKGMLKTNIKITSEEYFKDVSNRMLSTLGRRVNHSHPRAFGVLENNDRVSVIIPPYGKECIMSIRRFSAEPFTIKDLINLNMLSEKAAAFLWMVFQVGNINVGVVGNTGSGKTTLLNSLLDFIPQKSRMILVEDIPEIHPLQDQKVSIISNQNLSITMRDAILDSLRLRPDRVVIGEVRKDSEVQALKESCLAGQAMGTYFTYHSESAEIAYQRLISQGFPKYDLKTISMFVVCRRFEKDFKLNRRVLEIGGIDSFFGLKRNNLTHIENKFPTYVKTAFKNPVRELKERENFLKESDSLRHRAFFKQIQKWYYDL